MSSKFAYLNTRDLQFILQEWLPTGEIFNYPKLSQYSQDDVAMLLNVCRKMAKELIEPANEETDKNPCKFVNGQVITPPRTGPLFKQLQEEGWGTSNVDHSEEAMILPHVLYAAIWELFGAAYPAFAPYIALTNGAARLIQRFADEKLKSVFLPKMMDGSWSGTMCLTEPTAGSDVGEILSKAYPTDNPNVFSVKGNKIFITGGDNDFTENIVHLFLARVDGAAAGTRGISLFIVPKYWVNEDGSLEPNDVETTGIEHKMGQYGSVTAALSFGQNNNCRGWLLGANPLQNQGKGEGMSQMFQMMNEERVDTGLMALACIANAYYNARDYCQERVQGFDAKGHRVPIINHEDIKRTLLVGKAHMEAMRALLFQTYFAMDVRENDPDPEKRKKANELVEITTPLCKSYTTDEAWWLIGEAIQAYGGYGYCEEYPVAQIARDVKIYSIWEGTNYIQSMDLIGRKWMMGEGHPFAEFMGEINSFYKANLDNEEFIMEFKNLGQAIQAYTEIQKAIANYSKNKQYGMISLYARRILTATSQLYAGRLILDQALVANQKAKEIGAEHHDYDFYLGKILAARYYLMNIIPNVWHLAKIITTGDSSAIEIPVKSFDY